MGTDTSGKRAYQKQKPYIVLQILQRETDENHVLCHRQRFWLTLSCFLPELAAAAANHVLPFLPIKGQISIKNLLFIGLKSHPTNRRYSNQIQASRLSTA